MFKILAWLFVIAILFSACGVSGISYPLWYAQNNEDSRYLYGVGQADDLQSAKLMALNDLALQISMNIESSLNIHKQQIDSNISSKISNDIGISVNDIELDSVEYPLIENIDGVFFIQARMEKAKFISKLNSNVNTSLVAIKGLLGDIKTLNCNTISPKDKYKLQNLVNNVIWKNQQITSLGGKVKQSNLINVAQTIVSTPSSAYYVSFAHGGDSKDYQLIDNGLISEYTKFFSIVPKDTSAFYIENVYSVLKRDSTIQVKLVANIKDCNGSAIFSANVESSTNANQTMSDVVTRLKAQLYKKINTWVTTE